MTKTTTNTHYAYACSLVILIALSVFSSPTPLHASGDKGATIVSVPTASSGFPDTAEAVETLLHHRNGTCEPIVYKEAASKWPSRILMPVWLKFFYVKIPLKIYRTARDRVHESIPLQPQLMALSAVIENIESDEYHQPMAISINTNKEFETAIRNTVKQAMPLEVEETELEGMTLEDETHSLLSSALLSSLEEYYPFPRSFEKREKTITHEKWQFSSKVQLPPQAMELHIASRHHASTLYQPPNNSSQLIVQNYGQQKVMLIPPDCVYASRALFNIEEERICSSIDLSAPEDALRNEKRLANITIYSMELSPGDILVIPANWFVYKQSLSTSTSAIFTYFSDDEFSWKSQAELAREKK